MAFINSNAFKLPPNPASASATIGANHTPTQEQCLAAAYEANSRVLQPAAECQLQVARAFHDCVTAIRACNPAAFDNCIEEASDASVSCPGATADATRALTACLDTDTDGDGIYDDQDRCDTRPEDFDGYEDEDGCPDADAYERCSDDGDCPPTSLCGLEYQRFCSVYCSADSDCPSVEGHRGVCMRPGYGSQPICYQSCARDDDCVGASSCTQVDGVGVCD